MSGRLMIRPSQKRAGRFFVTTPCRGSRCTAISPAPQNGLIEIQCLLGCVALGFLVGGLLGAVEFKNCNRFDLWQHLDAFQLTVHSSTATTDLHVDYVLCLLQLFAYLVENAAKFPELGFYRRQHLPDFIRMTLNCERPETNPE